MQIAAIVALRHGEPGRLAQVAEYQARRDVLVDGLTASAGTSRRPRPGCSSGPPIPEPWRSQMGSIDFAMKLLEEAEVAVSPGRGFGETGEGFLRLALVENEQRLRQAVRQIGRCLKPAEEGLVIDRGSGAEGGPRWSLAPTVRGPSNCGDCRARIRPADAEPTTRPSRRPEVPLACPACGESSSATGAGRRMTATPSGEAESEGV